MSKEKELMTLSAEELAQLDELFGDMDDLDGLGTVSLDRIGMPGSGGTQFALPNPDDPEEPEMVNTIEAVIVAKQAHNVYYRDAYGSSDDNQPTCYSNDAEHGTTFGDCGACKFNKFGSAENGRGKACSNKVELYLMMEDKSFPTILDIPPSGIKALKEYIKGLMTQKRKLAVVWTRIGLKRSKGTGAQFAQVTFTKIRDITPAEAPAVKEQQDMSKDYIERNKATTTATTNDFTDLTESNDDDLPFDL